MSKAHTNLSRIGTMTLVALGAFTAPAMADFVGVSRCSQPGNSGASALHFVSGGDRFLVPTGQAGLSDDTVMSEREALLWAAASGLFPEGTSYGNYAGYICGMRHVDNDGEGYSQASSGDTVISDGGDFDPEEPGCGACD